MPKGMTAGETMFAPTFSSCGGALQAAIVPKLTDASTPALAVAAALRVLTTTRGRSRVDERGLAIVCRLLERAAQQLRAEGAR